MWRADDGPKKPLYTLAGQWTARTWATSVATGQQVPLSDVTVPAAPARVRPVHEQDEYESPRVWQGVTAALRAQDYATATQEKNTIEERQRQARREREAAGEEWRPRHFRPAPPVAADRDKGRGSDPNHVAWQHAAFPK